MTPQITAARPFFHSGMLLHPVSLFFFFFSDLDLFPRSDFLIPNLSQSDLVFWFFFFILFLHFWA